MKVYNKDDLTKIRCYDCGKILKVETLNPINAELVEIRAKCKFCKTITSEYKKVVW